MVRSVRSRPVAISTGRTSAAGSVRRSASTRSARPVPRRRPPITRSALRPIASGTSGSASLLLVALAAHDYAPPADHSAIHSGYDSGGVSFGDLNHTIALAQIHLAHMT